MQEEVEMRIPAGIENGEVIRMTGRGEAMPNGQSGDLYIKVHVEAHKTIKRDGTTLITDLPIRLTDALLGGEYKIETLDGQIEIKVPVGISHGEMLRVRGKGVPTEGNNRGDFLVRVSVELPKKLSKRAQKLVEELREEGV